MNKNKRKNTMKPIEFQEADVRAEINKFINNIITRYLSIIRNKERDEYRFIYSKGILFWKYLRKDFLLHEEKKFWKEFTEIMHNISSIQLGKWICYYDKLDKEFFEKYIEDFDLPESFYHNYGLDIIFKDLAYLANLLIEYEERIEEYEGKEE